MIYLITPPSVFYNEFDSSLGVFYLLYPPYVRYVLALARDLCRRSIFFLSSSFFRSLPSAPIHKPAGETKLDSHVFVCVILVVVP